MTSENGDGVTDPQRLLKLQRRAQRLLSSKTIKTIRFRSEKELVLTLSDGTRLFVDSKTNLDISIT